MNILPDISEWSLRKKLVSVIMLGSLVCLLISFLVLVTSILSSFHRDTLKNLSGLASLLAENGQAALTFADRNEADRLLGSLREHPEISNAWLVTTDGHVLSHWNPGTASDALPSDYKVDTTQLRSDFWARRAKLYLPVTRDNERVGYVLLQADFSGQWNSKLATFGMALGVAALALFVAFLLATRLQRLISRPIAEIAETARTIARNKTYELRVPRRTSDEIGDLVTAFNDMLSEIQERDEHLTRHRDHLEEEVALRTGELLRLKEEAESASHFKGMFLSNMSHEIRTPMNAIIGLSDLALSGDLSPKLHDYLTKIHSSSLALLTITNDILDYSKVEAGRMALDCEEFNLNDVLENLYNLFNVRAEKKGLKMRLELDPDAPHLLIGDPLRLGQVLNNLVGNAIKFTQSGEIHIKIKQTGQEAGYSTLDFSVRDTGIGLSSEQAARLFHAFTQGDGSITRRFGGTGLGLTISKQLVEIMGGNITLTSEPEVGSVFSFTIRLPVSIEMTKKEKSHPDILELAAPMRGAHILIVDDNEINRMVAREFLEHAGLRVSLAENGQEGIDAALGGQFDAVLMDVQMEMMSGLEATRMIRRHLCDLPVIAMTAAVLEQDRQACLDAGMNDHVAKPILPHVLLETLSRWVKARVADSGCEIVTTTFDPEPALLGGNQALRKRLLGKFGDKFYDASAELALLMQHGQTAKAAMLIHNIKGASGNLGITDLYNAAERLEAELKRNDVAADLAQFNHAMASALHAIAELHPAESGIMAASTTTCDACAWRTSTDHLKKLRALLEGNDYIPHELLEQLKASLTCQSMQQHFLQIEKFVGEFNYNQAVTVLDQLSCAMGYNLRGNEPS
jgi:two-component system sensor histidine kinase/response regulator